MSVLQGLIIVTAMLTAIILWGASPASARVDSLEMDSSVLVSHAHAVKREHFGVLHQLLLELASCSTLYTTRNASQNILLHMVMIPW